jgi:hypothetical protein
VRRSKWLILVGFVLALALVAQPASAYRKPHKRERTRITRAFHHHHRHWRKQHLKIQQIRVSKVNRHFAMVVFAKAVNGQFFTISKTNFFRGRRKRHRHAARAVVASDFVDDAYHFITDEHLPGRVEKDLDPLYTVTYYTLSFEQVQTKFQDVCSTQFYKSNGRYAWLAKWKHVPLTLPSFQAESGSKDNFISGHYKFNTCRGPSGNCDTEIKTLDRRASFANIPDAKGTTLFVGSPAYRFVNCNSIRPQGATPSTEAVTRVPLADVRQSGNAIFRQPVTQANLADRGTNCAPNRSVPCKRTIKLSAEIDYEKEN